MPQLRIVKRSGEEAIIDATAGHSVMEAITKRQIVPVGSLARIMMLVPLIKAAIRFYPEHYQACQIDT